MRGAGRSSLYCFCRLLRSLEPGLAPHSGGWGIRPDQNQC